MKAVVLLSVIFLIQAAAVVTSADKEYDDDGEEYTSLEVPQLPESSDFDDFLSYGFYRKSCPGVDGIIHRKLKQWYDKDNTIAASIIRLHFHDCVVRGCDASILLDNEGSERRAPASKTLRGFEVIDDIKAEVEKKCPKTVSCADILTAAAREATILVGGPYWTVPYGRRDGVDSIGSETGLVPMGLEGITDLIERYQSLGLNLVDLVVLSGAHTIGRASCGSIQSRLYNYSGTGKPDPSMSTSYVNFLRRKCRWASDYVDLDATTPNKFDNAYYTNLPKKMGLLPSDSSLYTDRRTAPIVKALAYQPSLFRLQFAVSMAKLGNVQVLTDLFEGEIRTNCSCRNY
ncbi:peroxidase 7-like [Cucurbita pepo subsp. pepo]|uniref:peroxidase 7-like n=1 Tax=Cucurbita pepo subsp. pepo TaxID=3664 RepID=UPI000C9D6276|nr:peroxidase 7-like [Cucurbita pepo subsp. pepo]